MEIVPTTKTGDVRMQKAGDRSKDEHEDGTIASCWQNLHGRVHVGICTWRVAFESINDLGERRTGTERGSQSYVKRKGSDGSMALGDESCRPSHVWLEHKTVGMATWTRVGASLPIITPQTSVEKWCAQR